MTTGAADSDEEEADNCRACVANLNEVAAAEGAGAGTTEAMGTDVTIWGGISATLAIRADDLIFPVEEPTELSDE